MATRVKAVSEKPEAEVGPVMEMGRKVFLAGIGAVAMAQDEMDRLYNKLVERGEVAEQDGRKMFREVMERRKKDAAKAEEQLDKRVEDMLNRMNVPTKADIDALSAKITALSKKMDELKKPTASS